MKASFTKKEIFIQAHKMAKTFTGNYSACFSLALKEIFQAIKTFNAPKVEENTNLLEATMRLKFNTEWRNGLTSMTLRTGTYEIKETLKSLGFKFNGFAKVWTIETTTETEALEIAKKLVA